MFGAYTPDENRHPQQWPPLAMVRFARSTPHLPMVEWLRPRRRRHSTALILFRTAALVALAAFVLARCGGLA